MRATIEDFVKVNNTKITGQPIYHRFPIKQSLLINRRDSISIQTFIYSIPTD